MTRRDEALAVLNESAMKSRRVHDPYVAALAKLVEQLAIEADALTALLEVERR